MSQFNNFMQHDRFHKEDQSHIFV